MGQDIGKVCQYAQWRLQAIYPHHTTKGRPVMQKTLPILIIGADGKTERRIANTLSRQGYAVRHGTRNAPIPFD